MAKLPLGRLVIWVCGLANLHKSPKCVQQKLHAPTVEASS